MPATWFHRFQTVTIPAERTMSNSYAAATGSTGECTEAENVVELTLRLVVSCDASIPGVIWLICELGSPTSSVATRRVEVMHGDTQSTTMLGDNEQTPVLDVVPSNKQRRGKTINKSCQGCDNILHVYVYAPHTFHTILPSSYHRISWSLDRITGPVFRTVVSALRTLSGSISNPLGSATPGTMIKHLFAQLQPAVAVAPQR